MRPSFVAKSVDNLIRRRDVLRSQAGCNDAVAAAIRGAGAHGAVRKGKFRGRLLILDVHPNEHAPIEL
jgi:hypothetical protein